MLTFFLCVFPRGLMFHNWNNPLTAISLCKDKNVPKCIHGKKLCLMKAKKIKKIKMLTASLPNARNQSSLVIHFFSLSFYINYRAHKDRGEQRQPKKRLALHVTKQLTQSHAYRVHPYAADQTAYALQKQAVEIQLHA